MKQAVLQKRKSSEKLRTCNGVVDVHPEQHALIDAHALRLNLLQDAAVLLKGLVRGRAGQVLQRRWGQPQLRRSGTKDAQCAKRE